MTRTSILPLLILAACGDDLDAPDVVTCGPGTVADGTTCIPDTTSCGVGTHDVSGTCVPDSITGTQVRVASQIVADGESSHQVRVFATNDDGTPRAGDTFVFNTDRPGAGTFSTSQVTLDERGAATAFVPCDGEVPGCAGPLAITVALASAPSTPVASASLELVAPPGVGSMDRCPPGENTFHVASNGYLYRGDLSIFSGGWFAEGGDRSARVSFGAWSIEISTVPVGEQAMAPGTYLATSSENSALLIIRGPGTQPECGTVGAFEVHEFELTGGQVQRLSLTFRERCIQAEPTELAGCLRYVRGL